MKTRKGKQTSRRAANTVVTSTNARRYRKLVMSLAAVVVFVTTYALILPALTLDEDKADSTPGIEVMTEQAAEEIAPEEKEKSSAQEQAVSEQPQESEQADSSNAGSSLEKPSASSGSDRKSNSESGGKVESADSDNELSLITERTKLKFDGAGYKIICEAGADAKLPADTKLKVKEIKAAEDLAGANDISQITGENGEKYSFEDLKAKAEGKDAGLFAVSFTSKSAGASSDEVAPAAPVRITVKYDDALKVKSGTSVSAVYFDTTGSELKVRKLETKEIAAAADECEAVKEISFKIDRNAAYGLFFEAAGNGNDNAGSDQSANDQAGEDQNAGEAADDQNAGGSAEDQSASEDTEADTSASLGKTVITADGDTYRISVTYGKDAGVPEGSELFASEITDVSSIYESYVAKTEDALGWEEGAASYVRLFDIRIMDPEGRKVEVKAPVDVKIELEDEAVEAGEAAGKDFAVIHFSGAKEKPEQIDTATDGNAVSFSTDGFSAYAIVQGPSAIPTNWSKITNMQTFTANLETGAYIGTQTGFYMLDYTAIGTGDANTTGIVKTKPAKDYPPDEAVKYYFEQVSGQQDQFYVYCYDGSGNKQYVHNEGATNLTLVGEEEKTPFTVDIDGTGRFRFHYGNRYWNMWNGVNGNHIAAYDKPGDAGNYFYVWLNKGAEGDPYALDGKTYGLMNWQSGTQGKALMAQSSKVNSLDALALTVMAKAGNNNNKLFVPDDSDISMWTFEWTGDDNKYYLRTVVDGTTKYLRIARGSLSLVSEPDELCRVQVIPGSGAHAGEICLKTSGATLTYSGNVNNGFGTGGAVGSEWLRLVEESQLTKDYFMTYSARKVSVSDPSVTNGSRIIVYTRVWNDETKKYEFYAIDHDGSLIRCYESGDDIQWVGSRLNSNLWNFTEYYWSGTTDPNYYYDLYNQYSEQFIAPQITGGQVLADEEIGVNLNGRRDGAYYSKIIAWDDPQYAYAGLRADVQSGKVVACPIGEADDFYFAIMQDPPVDDELSTVPTVDNTQHGITMKMVNFPNRNDMSRFLGSDDKYKNGNTEDGLLSTDLGEDGYPVTKGGGSLANWFAGASEVNHLFIASTYSGTGYYEYDSTQNFAHLDQSTNDFVVYDQIGTTDRQNGQFYTHGQFFPYNDIQAGLFSTKKNTTDAMGKALPESDPRKYEQLYLMKDGDNVDYYMGVEVDASFTQTPSGLDDWGHDIIYEFTGDDDFWLYVDGELIIDLGGIHDALPGSVNYRTGEVKVNGRSTTLRQLFTENYLKRNPGASDSELAEYLAQYFEEGSTIFKDYTTHTMKIFYLERGAGASNLHMRFNLASVRPGHVFLSKKLADVDATESVMSEFPYQIVYRTQDGQEKLLSNSQANDPLRTTDYVFYKDKVNPVKFKASDEIGGKIYSDVFYLKPGEVADISFPEDMADYRIIECGIDTDVFRSVTANGVELEGTEPVGPAADGAGSADGDGAGEAGTRKDFGIGYASPADRQRVDYVNDVDRDALRTITFKKRLFDADGTTELDADGSVYDFRLYMATEFEDLTAANMEIYHVKDENGNYCTWDVDQQKFVVIGGGITDYASMTAEQKAQAKFTTSMNGSISKIPVGYTVEIRNVLAGTKYRVQERPAEIPDGYSFQKYIYYDDYADGEGGSAGAGGEEASDGVEISGPDPDLVAMTGAPGVPGVEGAEDNTVVTGKDPHVDICNLKGHGLRVNKVWTDKDYMSERDPAYFAVFVPAAGSGQASGADDLRLVPGSVRQMPYGSNTLYWYWLRLPVSGAPFKDYVIREVRLEGSGWSVDDDGVVTVTDETDVIPIQDGQTVEISGKQKGESAASGFTYTVDYEEGQIQTGSNVRVDTVTNSRQGIVIKKTKWDGSTPLAGAKFELKDNGGAVIGTFTSGEDGMITTAFLRENTKYTLTETQTPQGWHGMDGPMTITYSAGAGGSDPSVKVSGPESAYYTVSKDPSSGVPMITVKNRPFTFKAVKWDFDTDAPIKGVQFALHKVRTVDGATQTDTTPLAGFETLTTNANGVIPKIDEGLPAGRYELREKKPGSGYNKLAGNIRFTVSPAGKITLEDHPEGAVKLAAQAASDGYGALEYVLTIRDSKIKKLRFRKVSAENTELFLSGAEFRLEKQDGNNTVTVYDRLVSGSDGLLAYGSGSGAKTAFDLQNGTYRLIETKAPAGYEMRTSPVTVTVSDSGVTFSDGTSASQSGEGVSVETQGGTAVYTVTITNTAGVELPSAGGPGTRWMYIFGMMLTIGAGVLLAARRRERVR